MSKKLFFVLPLVAVLAIGCTKSGEPVNPTTGGDEGGEGGEDGEGITMTVKTALAEYYGDYYDAGTQDWVLTLENTSTSESLCIEFFNEANSTDIKGSYDIDQAETFRDGTALPGYLDEDGYLYPTFYFNESSQDYALAVDGSLEITKSGTTYTIKADFTDETGRKFSCNYTGPVTIQKGEIEEGDDDEEDDDDDEEDDDDDEEDEVYTSLTSDITVSGISEAYATYFGDDMEAGTNDWILSLYNDNEELCFELFTKANATTPVGTFEIDLDYTCAEGTAWDGYYTDSYYSAYYNYDTEDYAYPASGTITIAKGSGTSYNITVAVYDELGHKISASYSGAMTIEEGEWEEEESSAYTAAHKYAGKAILKSHKAHKDVKAVKVSKKAKSGKAAKAKRAHKAKAIRIAR